MCLGIPGQILELHLESDVKMGMVDFDGVKRKVCFGALPEVEVGDYVLVHVGFALAKLDEDTARETWELFTDMGVVEGELGLGTKLASNTEILANSQVEQ